MLSTVQHYSSIFHIYFLVQIQRNDYKYNMEERHEKALIRKKAFVECVKKVKNNLCFVLSFFLVFSNVWYNTTHSPYCTIYFHHSPPHSPFAPSHFLTSICIWNVYLIVDTDDYIDRRHLSLCKQLFHSGRLPLIVLLMI